MNLPSNNVAQGREVARALQGLFGIKGPIRDIVIRAGMEGPPTITVEFLATTEQLMRLQDLLAKG